MWWVLFLRGIQQFAERPHVGGETSFHRGSNSQGFMHPAKVIVGKPQSVGSL